MNETTPTTSAVLTETGENGTQVELTFTYTGKVYWYFIPILHKLLETFRILSQPIIVLIPILNSNRIRIDIKIGPKPPGTQPF